MSRVRAKEFGNLWNLLNFELVCPSKWGWIILEFLGNSRPNRDISMVCAAYENPENIWRRIGRKENAI
jgi:hypothetical protein